ncbi:Sperm-associated antigen 6, partial [Entophlyctis luteolus]
FHKKAAAIVLRAVAKHSPDLAQSVVDSGALNAPVTCLKEFDLALKNLRHGRWVTLRVTTTISLKQSLIVDAGAIPLLVLCVEEPELSLKRIAASALSNVSKHSPE